MLDRNEAIEEYNERFPLFFAAIVIVFVILSARLFYLQVYKSKTYIQFSQRQSLRKEKLPGPRGQIFDRSGQLLVDNRMQLDITVHPQFTDDVPGTLKTIAELTGRPLDELQEIYESNKRKTHRITAVTVIRDAQWQEIVPVESRKHEIQGVDIIPRIRRHYLTGENSAHLIGYLSEVTESEIDDEEHAERPYDLGDTKGRYGLEQRLEDSLRGTDGAKYVIVNAQGRRLPYNEDNLKILGDSALEVEPVAGNNLYLTIDQTLQQNAYDALGEHMGAVVAMDPRTGEILAMTSKPGFDPNRTNEGDYWNSVVQNPDGALVNKTIQDFYPPGSTFKIFTALAALEAGIVEPKTEFFCPGYFVLGRTRPRCHKLSGHGKVSLADAFKKSCNVYFYNIASKLGINAIAAVAKKFGLGSKSGVSLNNEVSGLVPTEEWKLKARGKPWQPGETLSAAIGQGANLVTPIQLTQAYSALVNGGNLYKPYIVSRIENSFGDVIVEKSPEPLSNQHFNPEHIQIVKKGLEKVVNEKGGTAYWFARSNKVSISGKSGTTEVFSRSAADMTVPCAELPFKKRNHAWFVGYAPSKKPEIVVTAFGYHACGGSRAGGAIVKRVIEAWWDKKYGAKNPELAQKKSSPSSG